MRVGLGFVVGLLLLFGAGVASADVVSPPPTDCPEGSEGESSHGGPYCAPTDCGFSGTACEAGSTCATRPLCIVESKSVSRGGTNTVKHVVGPCGANGACAKGTCSTLSVCVAQKAGFWKSLLCSFSPSANRSFSGVGVLTMLGLGALIAARRRRGSCRERLGGGRSV